MMTLHDWLVVVALSFCTAMGVLTGYNRGYHHGAEQQKCLDKPEMLDC